MTYLLRGVLQITEASKYQLQINEDDRTRGGESLYLYILKFETTHAVSLKGAEDKYDVERCSLVMWLSNRDESGRWMFHTLECFQIWLHSFRGNSEGPRLVLRHLKPIILSRLEGKDRTSMRFLTVKAAGVGPESSDVAILRLFVPKFVVIG